ncbi:MAG: hypothetical protein WAT70_01415 [Rhizobiaceae bacterium]
MLRYEAADFANTVFETQALSPTRGASLSYLYSPKRVERELPNGATLVYKGASQGAWTFRATAAEAEKAEQRVRTALTENDFGGADPTGAHAHLAYVTALVEGDDALALASAESLCNVRKLQGEGFPLPSLSPDIDAFDAFDRARPADHRDRDGKRIRWKRKDASQATVDRGDFGSDQRQKFYESLAGRKPAYEFTDDFEAMVKSPPKVGGKPLPVSLHGKVAVFYADGNRLNKLRQAEMAAGMGKFKEFSESLRMKQQELLGHILDWLHEGARETPDAFLYNHPIEGDQYRFETLLWGGDELLFVMPSWLGLDFAARFFAWTKGWMTPAGLDITFSAGLVFCDHKTPIRLSKAVADEMASLCKTMQLETSTRDNQTKSLLQVEAFESLSLPEGSFKGFRENLYPGGDRADERDRLLAVPGGHAGTLFAGVAALKRNGALPRSQIYKLLRLATEEGFALARATERPKEKDGVAIPARSRLIDEYEKYRSRAGAGKAPEVSELFLLQPERDITTIIPSLALNLAVIAMLWDYAEPLAAVEGGEA